jgi:hypothetical protein
MVKSRFLVCKHLVQACHPIHADFFITAPARNRTVLLWKHPLVLPLAGPKPPNPDQIESAHEKDEDTPADLVREDFDDLDNADDVNLDSGLAPMSLSFHTAFKSISESLTFAMATLHSNRPFEDPHFTANILKHGAGGFKLFDQMRSLQRQSDSHTAHNPNTWGPAALLPFSIGPCLRVWLTRRFVTLRALSAVLPISLKSGQGMPPIVIS